MAGGRTQQHGREAEQRAEQYLQAQGLAPVTRNYLCRMGEIDLVMRDGPALVFVEVRLRRHRGFGDALASVDARKQQRLIRAAQHYLQRHPWDGPCRFDVVGLDAQNRISWIRDAFGLA